MANNNISGCRRQWLGAVALSFIILVAALLTPAFRVNAADETRPNMVFIISDDHRWDALGAAGNPKIHTPVLDQMAKDGAYFRQATIHVPQCTPSRASLLTGLPPHQHGYFSNQYQRADVETSERFSGALLPEILRESGYRTILVGKWHLPQQPWSCGFTDVRVWMTGGSGPYLNARLAEGKSRQTKVFKGFTNEVFANDAIEFLKSEAAQEKPFFLWLAATAPHTPLKPTPTHIETLYQGKERSDLLPPGFPGNIGAGDFKHYYQAVSHLDEQVGRVLKTLKESRLDTNTIVVFLGDNGFMMGSRGIGERGGGGKVVPYEESVRVPLIVRAPTNFKIAALRGSSNAPVSSLDLPSTFLQLAGVTPPTTWSGRDLRALLRGEKNHGITEAFCEFADNQSERFGELAYRLVRTPTHKLIVWEKTNKPHELYDLAADPRETRNLINDPAQQPMIRKMMDNLRVWMKKTNDPFLHRLQHPPA
ncbi:MAG TPA: sulfatase-like hydrolase/transferase [Abditibacteriaceae bacterium]|jgi:arylsulfatase A-like enzyme